MNFLKKLIPVKGDDLNQYLKEIQGIEEEHYTNLKKSEKLAWNVAKAAIVLAFVGMLSGVAGNMRHQAPPEVYRVNDKTGVIELITTVVDAKMTYGEAADIANLNTYVLNCESYNYESVDETYNTCAILSAPDVQREYQKKYFDGKKGRDQEWADRVKVKTEVGTINPGEDGTATIRYTTQKTVVGQPPEPKEAFVALVTFKYSGQPMKAKDRRINPFGFQVSSWRPAPDLLK